VLIAARFPIEQCVELIIDANGRLRALSVLRLQRQALRCFVVIQVPGCSRCSVNPDVA
jgi:hypothetical protein